MERALESYAKAQEQARKVLEKVKSGRESATREDILEHAMEQGENTASFTGTRADIKR